jgi:hypothetical protein
MTLSIGRRVAVAAVLLAALAGCDATGSSTPGSQPTPGPAQSTARRVGVEQPVSTAEFDALVIVAEREDPSPPPGDDPYMVDVTVAVTRGSWNFAPTLVRLIWSSGETHGPQENAPAPATLVAGQVKTWRLRFDWPAAVGIREGAKVMVVGPSGQELATWLT